MGVECLKSTVSWWVGRAGRGWEIKKDGGSELLLLARQGRLFRYRLGSLSTRRPKLDPGDSNVGDLRRAKCSEYCVCEGFVLLAVGRADGGRGTSTK
jgi:hypothetical protein